MTNRDEKLKIFLDFNSNGTILSDFELFLIW